MKYTVYKTINNVNQKYYIGVHKTKNPNDGYFGSGKLLLQALEKYGENNFEKIILFVFDDETLAFEKEKELLQECLTDPLCYNQKPGGYGGWTYVHSNNLTNKNKTKEHYVNMAKKAAELKKNNKEVYDRWYNSVKNGHPHTEDTKNKISLIVSERRKNQIWITDGVINKQQSKDNPIPSGFKRGRTIKVS